MALFNHLFPYTNLHDINLDWIISIIKSIDPAVIKALQELTPDTIAQVTQLVSDAQNYAISAQSSASDANTAKENAATSAAEAAQEATEAAADAALANADAVRAEAAKTAVENSLTVTDGTLTLESGWEAIYYRVQRSGNTVYVGGMLRATAEASAQSYVMTVTNVGANTKAIALPLIRSSDGTLSIGSNELGTDNKLKIGDTYTTGDLLILDVLFFVQ